MKNIHLIPTDKPSRLLFDKEEDRLLPLHYEPVFMEHQDLVENQNIYITSDEEIKPNVYCLINGVLCKTELLNNKIVSRQLVGGATMDICKSEYSEIILTTDGDLIKDGVQAIDDNFLEWFVKNPKCEEVKIFHQDVYSMGKWDRRYKIIIPSEEPKEEYICYKCQNKTNNKFEICDKCNVGWKEHKQETLEEAAKSYVADEWRTDDEQVKFGIKVGFIEGAKRQQERSYSEEEMLNFAWFLLKNVGQYSNDKTAHFEGKYLEQFKKNNI